MRSLSIIGTNFNMPIPHQAMPPRYSARLESVTKKAIETSMLDDANQFHQKVDCKPSPESNTVYVSISFESS